MRWHEESDGDGSAEEKNERKTEADMFGLTAVD